ncbi:MAG: hypothetical protein IJK66_04505 [Bacilli bacterium]|nr:hypothetical protein [Bacilli bacterium]
MEQNSSVVLENGDEYLVVNSLVYNDTRYLLLSNVSNVKDVCIRKIKKEDGKGYICRLDDKELQEVLKIFGDLKGNN